MLDKVRCSFGLDHSIHIDLYFGHKHMYTRTDCMGECTLSGSSIDFQA